MDQKPTTRQIQFAFWIVIGAGTFSCSGMSDGTVSEMANSHAQEMIAILNIARAAAAQWESASMRYETVGSAFVAKQNDWTVNSRAAGSRAWNGGQSRRSTESIHFSIRKPNVILHDWSESFIDTTGKLSITYRYPMAIDDSFEQSPFLSETAINLPRLSWYLPTALSFRNEKVDLLTGYDSETGNSLFDNFQSAQYSTFEHARFLGLDCGKITYTDGRGTHSIVICPTLGGQLLQWTRDCKNNDEYRDGKRIPDVGLRSSRQIARIVSFERDWSEFVVESSNEVIDKDGKADGSSGTTRYFAVSRPAHPDSLKLQTPIKNGTSVALMDSPQIKAEWRDGKVVRIYDGQAVKELAKVEMRPAQSSSIRWIGLLVGAVALVAGAWWMRRARNAALLFLVAILSVASDGQCLAKAKEGRYCGIYAVYGAAGALGKTSDFQELIDPKFVSTFAGSSLDDLIKAAEHLGVRATGRVGLGTASLLAAQDPLVLHVASLGQMEAYNHWVLFLGMDQDRARVIDGSGTVHLMAMSELLARWDGVALAVFTGENPKTDFAAIESAWIGWWSILAIGFVGGIGTVACHWKLRSRLSARPAVAFMICVPLLTLAAREAIGTVSFSRNPNTVRFLVAAEGERVFPKLTVHEVAAVLRDEPHTILFDARYAPDFKYGHLPRAKSLPVDADREDIEQALQGLKRDQPIVLYCQSSGCGFDDKMAIVLTNFGFTNIRMFTDGWVGWEEYVAKQP